jgi:hypothetical protein
MRKKPKFNPIEVSKLIKQIKEGATGSSMALGEILRLCMRLGQELRNDELLTWARSEATGYSDAEKLPDYRKMHTPVNGDFLGPMGSGLRNAIIAESAIEESHREALCNVKITQPVMELSDLVTKNSEGNILKIKWSGDAISVYQEKELYSNGLVLSDAWQVVSQQSLLGVLEIIRVRVLDFIIQIEESLGDELLKETQSKDLDEAEESKINQVFHNTIFNSDGNLAIGNVGIVNQTNVNVKKGDLNSLRDYLTKLGLDSAQLKQLDEALEADGNQTNEIGQAVSSWIMSITVFAMKGSLSVASNLIASLLATAILKYYGIQ